MSNFKNCIQPLFIPDTSPDKPGRPRFTLKPEGQSRMSRQEHHLSAANCATFVNAQRGREAQTPVLGEASRTFGWSSEGLNQLSATLDPAVSRCGPFTGQPAKCHWSA